MYRTQAMFSSLLQNLMLTQVYMYNTVIHRVDREGKLNQRSPAVGCLDDTEYAVNHRLKKKKH